MNKLKKALKKLATLGNTSTRSKPAQAAKKASAVKKKSQPVAKAKPAAAKKAAPVAKKAAPVKAKAPLKAKVDKKAAKPAPKASAKDLKKTAAPAKAASKVAAPASEKAGKKADKVADKAQEKVAKTAAPAPELAKAAKGRKKAEPEIAPEPEEEIVLLDAEGRRYCRVKDCDQSSSVDGYCRFHYLLFWKNIQVRKKILAEGKLERYIEELTSRYPDKYLDMLRKDLRSEKEFMAAIQELEIDEAAVDGEFEDEAQNYLDEVRGMGSETVTRDDDGDF